VKAWGVMRMGRTRRGNSGFAAEVGSHLGSLRIAAAADYTGSGTLWGIVGRAAVAVVRKD
jgi:hypothetical protein